MSLIVRITSPAPLVGVTRRITIQGTIDTKNDEGNTVIALIPDPVTVRFNGGPFTTQGVQVSGFNWSWSGIVPANVPPNAFFQISVTASGTVQEFDFETKRWLALRDSGSATITLWMLYLVPQLSLDPFQTPVGVLSTNVPYMATLSGGVSVSDPGAYHPAVSYKLGNGAFSSATITGGRWSTPPVPFPVGDTLITIQASDEYGEIAAIQQTLTVHQYVAPSQPPPDSKPTSDLKIPSTSSITSWTRLEPQVSSADMGLSSSARLFDPLWMMTRQWQMGEFQAEDAGSPVQARVRATTALVTRSRFGAPGSPNAIAAPYNPATAPLEALVERRVMRAASYDDLRTLPFRVEAGLHFLRMLEQPGLTKSYRNTFIAQYTLVPLSYNDGKTYASADEETKAFVSTMGGRALDAQRLAAVVRGNNDTSLLSVLGVFGVATADQNLVLSRMRTWLGWYDGLFAEPASPAQEAWTAPRLEYATSVAARLSATSGDSVTLSASEFDGGRLDWSSFDVDGAFAIDTTGDATFTPLNERTVPLPVTIPGAPAARFWEMEDAKVAYGLVSVGPTDLAHLMMIEYASSYGNDWYLVPLEVRVGTITRVDSLIVTDTFGRRMLVRPMGHAALQPPHFSMWQQSAIPTVVNPFNGPVRNQFFLPPTINRSIDGPVLEDVLFARDEMANVAWGIERTIEGGLESAVSLTTANGAASSQASSSGNALPRYLLSSTIPENWVPLLPVEVLDTDGVTVLSRLRRGAVLVPDGSNTVHQAKSETLRTLGSALLFDEEVPREGVHITRRRRLVRWMDGSTWAWTAFRNDVGTGEGSAGLVFDQLQDASSAVLAAESRPSVAVSMSVAAVVINGPTTPYSVNIDNPGPALSSVSVQAWIRQGAARRAAGGMLVDAGSGAAVLPNGKSTVAGTIAVDNGGTGSGMLTFGDAVLEVELEQGAAVVVTATVPLSLVHQPTIAGVSPGSDPVVIDGVGATYTVTLENPGPAETSIALRTWVNQGTARRGAGSFAVSCGAGAGVLPNGTSPVAASMSPSNGADGTGTLAPGAATLEVQLVDGAGNTLDTKTAPVTLAPNTPVLSGVAPGSTSVVIGGTATSYAATLVNPGPSLSNVVLQGWINQGTARRAAGGSMVMCGAGPGILPNGRSTVTGSIVGSNTTGGTGTLVPGDATFELQLIVNGTVVQTQFAAVSLEPNVPWIVTLTPAGGALAIGAGSVPYTATVKNPGASQSSVVLQGYINQGATRRAAGGFSVDVGNGSGVLPNGVFSAAGSITASNTTGGTGTLVPGAATFELQLLSGGTLLYTRTLAVTLQPAQSISLVTPPTSAVLIDGPGRAYSVTTQNLAPSLSNISAQATVTQGGGAAQRAAGSIFSFGGASGVLPTGSSTGPGVIVAANGQTGSGTLTPGAATLQVQLKQGTTVLATNSAPLTLVAKPVVAGLAPTTGTLVIGGAAVAYTATIVNSGPALSNVQAMCWITQPSAQRYDGKWITSFGAGTAVLPNGSTQVTGTIVASNSQPGNGTLVPGPANIEFSLWLMAADGTGQQIDKRVMSVSLVSPTPAVADVSANGGSLIIDGPASAFTATLRNPGSSLSSMRLQGWIREGSARRDAGSLPVNCGSGSGVLPSGSFSVSGPVVASNSAPGSGQLLDGAGTFELQLLDGTGTVIAAATAPVDLETGIIISPPAGGDIF